MIEIRHTHDTQSGYDAIYRSDAIQQQDSLLIRLLDLIDIQAGDRMLDVATGRGQFLELSERRGAEVYGIDFSLTACKEAKRTGFGQVLSGDGEKLPFGDEVFDLVTNLGSIEHFENMEDGLKEMVRVLKPGGRACITVPNTYGKRWTVRYAWKTGEVFDDGQPLQRYGTRGQWETLFGRCGFKVIEVSGYEHEEVFPRTWKDFFRYLNHPKRLLKMLFVAPFVPVNAAMIFIFICEVRKENNYEK